VWCLPPAITIASKYERHCKSDSSGSNATTASGNDASSVRTFISHSSDDSTDGTTGVHKRRYRSRDPTRKCACCGDFVSSPDSGEQQSDCIEWNCISSSGHGDDGGRSTASRRCHVGCANSSDDVGGVRSAGYDFSAYPSACDTSSRHQSWQCGGCGEWCVNDSSMSLRRMHATHRARLRTIMERQSRIKHLCRYPQLHVSRIATAGRADLGARQAVHC
jgi:hypothetical protein